MLRGQIAGEELQVDVLPITEARAAELLEKNADVAEGKLRRLLLSVESVLGERVGFRVLDVNAARRLVLRRPRTRSPRRPTA